MKRVGAFGLLACLPYLAAVFLPRQAGAVDSWTKVVGNSVMPLGDGFGDNGQVNTSNKGVDALAIFHGFLYAAVGQNGTGNGNAPSLWRTADLVQWTNLPASIVATDIPYMEANVDGVFLGTGNRLALDRAHVWKSADGVTWTWFTGPGSGYNPVGNFVAMVGLQGPTVYVATANYSGGQVWKRPTNGSTVWTKGLDFNTGFGTTDGPQTNLWATYLYSPPSLTGVMFYATMKVGSVGCFLYQTADGGATWQKNAAVASGFGTYNSDIAALLEFKGYLYASTARVGGGELWRTPLANAANWSSATAWERVVSEGFGYPANVELHRLAASSEDLWVCLTSGPLTEQVWRSADGTHWVQSNVSGFAPGNNARGTFPALAAFTNVEGTVSMVWGGVWLNPTNSELQAAQVWATSLASPYALWAQSHIPMPDQRAANQNPDNDPCNNWQEYVADTDPTNAASYFHITAVSSLSPHRVDFVSSSKRQYTLNMAGDLASGMWTNVPGQNPRLGAGGPDWMADTNSLPRQFYRVTVSVP